MPKKYIEVLFPHALQSDDIDVITPASFEQPGLARLNKAVIGEAYCFDPEASSLHSRSGAKLGFISDDSLLEPPFDGCYRLEDTNAAA
ncbi:MAG: hypothetical protein KDJ65_01530 [Anaerolineae bacterium]|nr:hypothetical protein [Anaerolineae bacterium]